MAEFSNTDSFAVFCLRKKRVVVESLSREGKRVVVEFVDQNYRASPYFLPLVCWNALLIQNEITMIIRLHGKYHTALTFTALQETGPASMDGSTKCKTSMQIPICLLLLLYGTRSSLPEK